MEERPHLQQNRGKHISGSLAPRVLVYGCLLVIVVIGLSLAIPSNSHLNEKSPTTKAITHVMQLITALRLYALDHNGKYPAKIDEVADFDGAAPSDWDKIKYFNAAADGKPHPWLVALDLADSDPSSLPVVMSPLPTKEGVYIMGMNGGAVSTTYDKAVYEAAQEELRKFREKRDAPQNEPAK